MATVEEKQATIRKLQAELQAIEDDKMVDGLVKDVESKRNHGGKIVARSVSPKYGYFVIPHHVLEKLARRLNLQYVSQTHYSDPDADYCGDGSCTYLVLGPPVKPECDKCPACGK
jgi:hypothetical protein